jgi:selenocysteine lyase/cysteine desulfurase
MTGQNNNETGKINGLLNPEPIRPLFPVKKDWLYFNFSADGPLPVPARDAIIEAVQEKSERGMMAVRKQVAVFENIRQELSVLFHSAVENFAFTKNTSEGVLLALLAMDIKEDENYITAADAFPTTLKMMENNCKGRMRTVTINSPVPMADQLLSVIDNRTRAIVLDWVHFFSGTIIDIQSVVQLAREKGIFTVIDGIQGAGALDLSLDSSGIDFFVTAGHKWLLSPQGSGFIYVSPHVWERIERRSFGWLGYDWQNFSDFSIHPELREGAAVMEYGTRSFTAATGFHQCLKVINSIGIKAIEEHNQTLRKLFIRHIIEKGYDTLQSLDKKAASIVPFRKPGSDPMELIKALYRKKVLLSLRNGYIRTAFHLVNDLEEVEQLKDML